MRCSSTCTPASGVASASGSWGSDCPEFNATVLAGTTCLPPADCEGAWANCTVACEDAGQRAWSQVCTLPETMVLVPLMQRQVLVRSSSIVCVGCMVQSAAPFGSGSACPAASPACNLEEHGCQVRLAIYYPSEVNRARPRRECVGRTESLRRCHMHHHAGAAMLGRTVQWERRLLGPFRHTWGATWEWHHTW